MVRTSSAIAVRMSYDHLGPMGAAARRLMVVAGLALLFLLAASVPSAQAEQQGITEWADGTGWQGGYLIEQSVYPTRQSIPAVLVRLVPKMPRRLAVLEVFDPESGQWIIEDRKLSINGVARLRVDPFCSDGRWCDGTFRYRVTVLPSATQGGLVSRVVRLRFVPA